MPFTKQKNITKTSWPSKGDSRGEEEKEKRNWDVVVGRRGSIFVVDQLDSLQSSSISNENNGLLCTNE